MITYDFLNTAGSPIDEATIKTGLLRAEQKLGDIGERFVAIEAVSVPEMRELNHKLRNQDSTTDIISISSIETEAGEQLITIGSHGELSFDLKKAGTKANPLPTLGQLIVCHSVIAANALQAGQPPEAELEWVIEHGVYHLMGFHHADDH